MQDVMMMLTFGRCTHDKAFDQALSRKRSTDWRRWRRQKRRDTTSAWKHKEAVCRIRSDAGGRATRTDACEDQVRDLQAILF